MKTYQSEYLEITKLNNVSILGVAIFTVIISVVGSRMSEFVPMVAIPVGIVLILFIMGKSSGVEFDFSNHVYRIYKQNIFGKKGKWKCLDPFTDVVILKKKGGKIAQSLTGDNTLTGQYMELYLMYPDHRKRLFICATENTDEIKSRLEVFTKNGFQYVKYDPVRRKR